MKRKIIFFLVLGSIFCPLSAKANHHEELSLTPQQIVENQQQSLDLRELEAFMREIDQEIALILPEFSFSQIMEKFKKGNLDFSPQEALKKIVNYFWREVVVNLSLLGKLLVIAVVCTILQTLQAAFEKGTVARLAYFICFLAVITLAISSFKVAITAGIATIDKMVEFMKLLLPLLLVLLTAVGGLTTTALLQPFLLFFLSFMSAFTQKIIFPLIFLTSVLCIANNISDDFKVSRLVGFFKQMTKVGIGLVLTLFIGVISVEGVAGAVVDGVTLRTAKYMTGAFVPVAGNMFADALDAVIGGSLLLKNALGLTGVLVLGAIILFPVIKILALAVVYRLAAALLQPLGDSLLANTLEEMAGCLFLTFAAVASVTIMFFMTITIIVGTANFTVMLR
ncbi:MAG: stage III sporulation protein AE [Clostridia bacterium]|nr:stage III sporulation protein AE [Clostridia bacterium]